MNISKTTRLLREYADDVMAKRGNPELRDLVHAACDALNAARDAQENRTEVNMGYLEHSLARMEQSAERADLIRVSRGKTRV